MSYAPATYRPALGATPVSTPVPVAGRAQPPIYPLIVGNNGAFRAVRSSPAQGSCGTKPYPCMHPGTDVNGPRGTKVRAPEDGLVVVATSGASSPWVGYGPWLVVIQGASGKFHLLAHLDGSTALYAPVGMRVRAGDIVGTVSSANHVHWELRRRLTPPAGQTNLDNNEDPVAWLGSARSAPIILLAGAALVAVLLINRR